MIPALAVPIDDIWAYRTTTRPEYNQRTTGAYFDQQRVVRADAQAYDVTVRRALRAQTTELVRRFV